MGDTLFADVSEWQVPVNDQYPHQVLSIRACDGTYRDNNFAANYAWAHAALDSGRLKALIVYCVYRTNWAETLSTMMSMVGVPHPRMIAMIDVESWGGQITGNQSDGINRLYWGLAGWLGNPSRVIAYGNTGDLNALWPTKPPGVRLIVASYGANPDYPGKLAHQFANNYVTPPFGACDINSADGYDIDSFCAALGLESDQDMTPEEHQMLQDCHDELFRRIKTRAGAGPNLDYEDTTLGYACNSDAFGFRNEQRLASMQTALWTLIRGLASKGVIDSTALADEYNKLALPAWPQDSNPFSLKS